MMRRVLLAAAIIAFMAAPAQATKNGKYLQNCPLANTGQVDPLVSPGAQRISTVTAAGNPGTT